METIRETSRMEMGEMLTEKKIKDLLKGGERLSLECKESTKALSKSIWESYSSFANTAGGVILLGIKEESVTDEMIRFKVVGVSDAEKCIGDFWNTINSNKVSENVLVDENVGVCDVDGKTVVYIEVPKARYDQKPVFVNENPYKGTYKRNHEGDYHCQKSEVNAMIRDASEKAADEVLLEGYTMDDIDMESFRGYRIRYELVNPDHVWNRLDDKMFLRNIGGYAVDRAKGIEGLTIAGLLMFGTGLAVRECFNQISMDYLDMSNLFEGQRWRDRITYDGTWENNLFNFVTTVMPKLTFGLPRPFKLVGFVRQDDTDVHKAVREALLNTVIHADYHISGTIKIVKYDNGYFFSNPGSLRLPVEDIYEGGRSLARNPRLQSMFRMVGLGDNIGSGFPKILNTWRNENWTEPILSENFQLNLVELEFYMYSLVLV